MPRTFVRRHSAILDTLVRTRDLELTSAPSRPLIGLDTPSGAFTPVQLPPGSAAQHGTPRPIINSELLAPGRDVLEEHLGLGQEREDRVDVYRVVDPALR